MNQSKEIAVTSQPGALAQQQPRAFELDVQRVLDQTIAVQHLVRKVLREGEHYGVLPGVKARPGEEPEKMLFKSGAEKLCLLFRLRPEYEFLTRIEEPTRIIFVIRCRLKHIQSGEVWGEGVGSCNSNETKFYNQTSAKLCPECGKAAIIRAREDYRREDSTPVWLCYGKKDGCGKKFKIDDPLIVEQAGRVVEQKVWDLHNTMLKMGQKRAMVAAVLTATAASDIFTQDLEELEEAEIAAVVDAREPAQPKVQQQPPTSKPKPQAPADQVLRLNQALADAEVGTDDRMDWINGMLKRWDEPPIKLITDLGPQILQRLIGAAEKGERA